MDVCRAREILNTFRILTQGSSSIKPGRVLLGGSQSHLPLSPWGRVYLCPCPTDSPPPLPHTHICTYQVDNMIAAVSLVCGWGFFRTEHFSASAGQDQNSSTQELWVQVWNLLLPERMGISWRPRQGDIDQSHKDFSHLDPVTMKPKSNRQRHTVHPRQSWSQTWQETNLDHHLEGRHTHSVTPCKEPKDPYAEECSRQGLCLGVFGLLTWSNWVCGGR